MLDLDLQLNYSGPRSYHVSRTESAPTLDKHKIKRFNLTLFAFLLVVVLCSSQSQHQH